MDVGECILNFKKGMTFGRFEDELEVSKEEKRKQKWVGGCSW